MSLDRTSLTTLLGLSEHHDFHQRVLTISAGTDEDLEKTKGRIAALVKNLQWKAIEGDIRKKTMELLDIDAMTLVNDAWHKYAVLAEFAEKSKQGETAHVPLTEHSITAELHPYLEIQIEGAINKKIIFDISVEFKLKGLMLKIENGKIVEVEAGSCEGSGEIKVEEHELLHKDFGPIPMPGKVNLGSGIPVV